MDHLKVPVRSPGLEVVGVGFVEDTEPLWWSRTLFPSDQYEFHTRLGPIKESTHARGALR